jgi:hypothetical protein
MVKQHARASEPQHADDILDVPFPANHQAAAVVQRQRSVQRPSGACSDAGRDDLGWLHRRVEGYGTFKKPETVESRGRLSDFWGMHSSSAADSQLDDPSLQGNRDGMATVVGTKFREYVRDMALDGRLANGKQIGNCLIGVSGSD